MSTLAATNLKHASSASNNIVALTNLISNFSSGDEGGFHPFRDLVELIQIPVFESKTKDSIDFLISLDPYLSTKNLYQKNEFTPVIIGFNNMRLVSSTHHPKKCLCVEGLIDIIAEMNVDLLKNLI